MIIEKGGYRFDVDTDATREYYKIHSVCNCAYCRNFEAQAGKYLPKLKVFLDDFGVDISRPDETGPQEIEEDKTIDYSFAAYTVCGRIIESCGYEIDIEDNGFLSIVADKDSLPNEQSNEEFFSLTVYNIVLPWALEEPFPVSSKAPGMLGKIKKFFKKE